MKRTSKKQDKPLIILTAGGTGGHVYPAESLAEELIKRGYRLALVTDKRGKDNYKGKLGEIPNYAVFAGALVGKSKFFKIKSLFKTCLGIIQAGYIILKNKPKCVVGFGGYASFPCCMAAILLGVDLVIHEQNSVMSRTNRFLSKHATLIAQSFKNVKYTPAQIKTILTGMPIRKAIIDIKDVPYPSLEKDDKAQIMILGGSQGAKVFGDIFPEAVKKLDKDLQKKLKIYQQCRECDIKDVKSKYKGIDCDVVVSHYFDNMPELYSKTHLILSRAGASSVSEIAVVGIPSILVPLPIAADDHQTYNASEIGNANAGIVIKQKDFTVAKITGLLNDLLGDYEALQIMSKNASRVGIVDAAERFADAIEKEIIKEW